MLRRFGVGAISLCLLTQGWGMDEASRKLADRYLAILAANPAQTVAFDRLWQIYAEQGETAQLMDLARSRVRDAPVFAARLLRKGGEKAEARATLEPRAPQEYAAATLLAAWIEEDQGTAQAAETWASWRRGDAESLVFLGELWSRAGQSQKAQAAWRQAVEVSPHDVALRHRLAETAAQAGDWDEALNHWRMVAKEGSPPERLEAWEMVAEQAGRAGRWNDAIEAQEQMLDMLGPGHWKRTETERRLIHLYDRAGRLAELEGRWTKEADQSNDPALAKRLAGLFAYRQDVKRQLRWLRRAVELAPQDVELLQELVREELAAGNLTEASAATERLRALRPSDTDAVFLQAEVAALKGDDGAAVTLVDKLLGPDAEESLKARAQEFYVRLRLLVPQERLLKEATEASPKDLDQVLTLARFYLQQKRFSEAVASMDRYPLDSLPAEEAGESALRVAHVLQEARLEAEALRWAQKAWEKNSSPEAALAAAELLDLQGRRAEARALVEDAARTQAIPSREVDRRIFAALDSYRPEELLVKTDDAVKREIIGGLQQAAMSGTTDQAWLRLVRWRRWNGEPVVAEESCRSALKLFPKSRELQAEWAELLLADGRTDEGIVALRELAVLTPDQGREIERRIGHLELDRSRPEEAEKIFRAIWQAQPDDWSAGADVAIAQQGSGEWFEALETWMAVWQLAPAEGRRTIRSSILGAVARLQLLPRGLAFLEEAAMQERDEAARTELLREGAIFAREQEVLDDWKGILRKHLAEGNAPSFWREGLALALREQGMSGEASALLREEAATDRPETREFLLDAAKQNGDFAEAARLAGQMARQTQTSAAWMRWADVQEQSGDSEAAHATWQTLTIRWARDPEVLLAAGDFYERQGDREAAEKWRRAGTRFEAVSPAILLQLGRAALARGDRDQAYEDWERLLASTRPDATSLTGCLPWPFPTKPEINTALGRGVRAGVPPQRGPWLLPSPAEPQGCRLLAIKELGRLLSDSPRKAAWLGQFTEPTERIWALYYTGDAKGALQEILTLKLVPEEAFAVLAWQAGQGEVIRNWAVEEPERWPVVIAGLAFLLDQHARVEDSVLADALAQAPPVRRWEVAEELAGHRQYRQASQVAENVPNEVLPAQAASAYLKMAEWQIALRDPARARQMLDRSLTLGSPTIFLTRSHFSVLRARWLLTPEEDRPRFEEAELRRLDTLGDKAVAALSRALLAALAGEPEKAADFLAQAATAAPQAEWNQSIQENGAQLEQWDLPWLARDLYRNTLSQDAALASLRQENNRRLHESGLIQSSLHTASRPFARYLRAEWKARGVTPEELLLAARRLLADGQEEKAAEIVAELCREKSSNDAVSMGIFSFTPQRRLSDDLSLYVDRVLADPGSSSLARNLAVQAGLRLAGTARQDGDYARELKLLEKLKGDAVSQPTLVLSRSQALCRLGRPREALELLEKSARTGDPTPYALALAELYATLGREKEAMALLRRQLTEGNPAIRLAAAVRLRELAVATEEPDALAATQPLLSQAPPGPNEASGANWPLLLARLDQEHPAPVERFQAGAEFLLGQGKMPPVFLQQELRRLEGLALDHPDLSAQYYIFRTALARQRGHLAEWEGELVPQWKAGSYFAGEILIQLYLEQGRQEELEAVLDRYLTKRSFREVAWQQLARDLLKKGQYRLVERVLQAGQPWADGDAAQDLVLAEARQKQGRPSPELVDRVEELASISPGLHLPLARYYLRVKELTKARSHLEKVSRTQAPDAEVAATWSGLAAALLEAQRAEEAGQSLAEALRRDPDGVDADLVARYCAAKGAVSLNREFEIPPTDRRRIDAAMLARWQNEGRHDLVMSAFEKEPGLLNFAELRDALQKSETSDWERSAGIWKLVENQPSLWDVQAAAAQCHARRAATVKEQSGRYLEEMTAAQRLDPGDFALTSALVMELNRRGKPAQAARAIEVALRSFGSAADRAQLRKLQQGIQMVPTLPKEN